MLHFRMLCILQCFTRFTATPGGRCVEVEVGVGEGGAGVVPRTLPHLRAQEVVRDSRSSDATCSWLARQLKSFSCCCSPRGPAGGGSSLEWLRLVEVFFVSQKALAEPPEASLSLGDHCKRNDPNSLFTAAPAVSPPPTSLAEGEEG